MQNKDIIKSLVKSIRVLEIINSNDGCTLSKIHNLTSIPKPTLIRILNTLEYCHVIRKNLIDNQYRSNFIFSGDRFRERIIGVLTAVSGKVLDRLCSDIIWPSDLLIRNGIYMEVVETTRKHTPLSVNRNKIGDKVDMLSSAVGSAYISFCSESERNDLVNDLKKSSDYNLLWTKSDTWLRSIIESTLAAGYGSRDIDFHGAHKGEKPKNDGLSAIAVPVYVKGDIVGCINLLWPSRLFTPQEFAKGHLQQLKQASMEITRQVDKILVEPQYNES
ncbi:hypothetical protein GCM10011348_15330 [Marinobacterium nitratireducens]|uniref:Transcriptional regulator, IclR family n=1 Tax=Marinobacterium nitratireducens TaxID=518897 RepID=A0A918DRC0_9GAMM|nr:helix-turn-helix domain-containing protein [Marinobacterium nitratireducens]GGO79888.1 hypothetical protein GCM10011348_15330 [Marinobacterium nitratireducens]